MKENIVLRQIEANEAEEAATLEAICFPPEEACTLPIMRERVKVASDCFFVAINEDTGKMIGFINGLCTDDPNLEDEIFTDASLHDPYGANIMICGVDVLPEYRGQGIARKMMAEFLKRQKKMGRKQAVLTCVPGKIAMYESFGFTDLGPSASTWGGEKWHEMKCILDETVY